jgi:hypothetical protein
MFGFFLKPSEEKSRNSHRLIHEAFAKRIKDPTPYVIAYAYLVKKSIFGQSALNFAVGFSEDLKEVIVIPVNSDVDKVGDAICLNKEIISSAKIGLQGEVKIRSEIMDKEIRFILPPYTTAILENAYILPIIQEREAERFKRFIKENF